MSASSDRLVATSVVLPADLHARPAGQVAKLAAGFDAEVELVAGTRTARAISVLAVMSLGAQVGQQIEIRASGPDAMQATAAIAAILEAAEAVAG
jgi:phosphotransferase system HPr (HPr) family protein